MTSNTVLVKSVNHLAITLSIILILALTLLALGMTNGCGTNAPTKAAQADKVLIVSVNAGLPVIVAKINAGKLTRAQCAKFDTFYHAYYAAQITAKAAIEKAISLGSGSAVDVDTANAAVAVAESDLLAFINSVL